MPVAGWIVTSGAWPLVVLAEPLRAGGHTLAQSMLGLAKLRGEARTDPTTSKGPEGCQRL